ncbi:MAG: class I mannose-6-phosphate isomerase [Alteripontixanthobacter sp.]
MSFVRLLPQKRVEKVWGRDALPAPFAAPRDARIGEIWFEPPGDFDRLLAKYLFTSENLSVQVHPDDAHAPHGMTGKDECWLILEAEPGARLAIGLERDVSRDGLAQAAQDGSIESLLTWHEPQAGDFFYLPAGTIHAVGPGLSLIEIQQNCDITYRLYDYGRPRELHLEQALEVAERGPFPAGLMQRLPAEGSVTLVDGPKFRLDRAAAGDDGWRGRYSGMCLVMPVSGSVNIGEQAIAAGECAAVSDCAAIDFSPFAQCLVAQPIG